VDEKLIFASESRALYQVLDKTISLLRAAGQQKIFIYQLRITLSSLQRIHYT